MTYQMEVEVAMSESLVEQMLADALEAERLRVEARGKLVGAVRRGAAAGMSQREIARAVNRSQPEVARLLRFFPASERGSMLAKRRREVIDLAARHGFRNVRVFGSVARGDDGPESDIDLLVTLPRDASLSTSAPWKPSLPLCWGSASTWCRRTACDRIPATISLPKRSRCEQ
jgi:hypothetical protein